MGPAHRSRFRSRAAVIVTLAALPILWTPNVVVARMVVGGFRVAIPGALLFAADGWIATGYVFVWQIALFLSLGESLLPMAERSRLRRWSAQSAVWSWGGISMPATANGRSGMRPPRSLRLSCCAPLKRAVRRPPSWQTLVGFWVDVSPYRR